MLYLSLNIRPAVLAHVMSIQSESGHSVVDKWQDYQSRVASTILSFSGLSVRCLKEVPSLHDLSVGLTLKLVDQWSSQIVGEPKANCHKRFFLQL